jgi:predicted ester cyclase
MAQNNSSIVRRLLEEAWGHGLQAVLDEIIDPGFSSHISEASSIRMTHWTGPSILSVELAAYRSACPDLQVELHDIITQEDRVAAFWRLRGTNTGTLQIRPLDDQVDEEVVPTGKVLETDGIGRYKIADGKIREARVDWEPLGLLDQVRLFASGHQVLTISGEEVNVIVDPVG